jgi:multimeric flavodoxin WrbA
MSSKYLVIQTKDSSESFDSFIKSLCTNRDVIVYEEGMNLQNKTILFAIELNNLGYDLNLLDMLSKLCENRDCFKGSVAGVIVKSPSDHYTKSFTQDIILHTNNCGLSFVGHSVVEILPEYKNFQTWQKVYALSLEDICVKHCNELIERLGKDKPVHNHKVLALHSSSYKTSNTLGIWSLVKKELKQLGCEPEEIHIENGTVVDCKGCKFQTCMYFGQNRSCFYGGVMVEEVLPAIEESDIIVWICPNYNDAISANMLAVINRLTVLYRQISFHDKVFYAIVVSGNSGSDSVAKQLIGALNINKGFYLPAYYSIMEIANEPLKVLEIDGMWRKAKAMAQKINTFCQK